MEEKKAARRRRFKEEEEERERERERKRDERDVSMEMDGGVDEEEEVGAKEKGGASGKRIIRVARKVRKGGKRRQDDRAR